MLIILYSLLNYRLYVYVHTHVDPSLFIGISYQYTRIFSDKVNCDHFNWRPTVVELSLKMDI